MVLVSVGRTASKHGGGYPSSWITRNASTLIAERMNYSRRMWTVSEQFHYLVKTNVAKFLFGMYAVVAAAYHSPVQQYWYVFTMVEIWWRGVKWGAAGDCTSGNSHVRTNKAEYRKRYKWIKMGDATAEDFTSLSLGLLGVSLICEDVVSTPPTTVEPHFFL